MNRAISSTFLTLYPERDEIAAKVSVDLAKLGVDGIEVQALVNGQQITLVSTPTGAVNIIIRDSDSLCSLVVGSDTTLWVADIADSEFLKGHSAVEKWNAWCAAPIHIYNSQVGPVSALDFSRH